MTGEQQLSASDRLAKHIGNIDDYLDLANVRFSNFHEEYLVSADMSRS